MPWDNAEGQNVGNSEPKIKKEEDLRVREKKKQGKGSLLSHTNSYSGPR